MDSDPKSTAERDVFIDSGIDEDSVERKVANLIVMIGNSHVLKHCHCRLFTVNSRFILFLSYPNQLNGCIVTVVRVKL